MREGVSLGQRIEKCQITSYDSEALEEDASMRGIVEGRHIDDERV